MWENWGLHPSVPEEIKTHTLATRLGLFWVKVLSTLPFEALPSYRSQPQLHNGCGEHEQAWTFEGLWPRGRRQRRFRCPFLPLRSFWVLCPGLNVQPVFLDHIWEGVSPALLHGMMRSVSAVSLTQCLCHLSSVPLPLPLFLAGSHEGLMKTEFPQQLSPKKSKRIPPSNNDQHSSAPFLVHMTSIILHVLIALQSHTLP